MFDYVLLNKMTPPLRVMKLSKPEGFPWCTFSRSKATLLQIE